MVTYGILMRMKTRKVKKEIRTDRQPMTIMITRFSLGIMLTLVLSRMMKPMPPRVKRKLEAKPSIMYWPLILHCIKATGLDRPMASVVDPTLGGSTITSYMTP